MHFMMHCIKGDGVNQRCTQKSAFGMKITAADNHKITYNVPQNIAFCMLTCILVAFVSLFPLQLT